LGILAVIPAPIAYINVVAVKKLVVGFLMGSAWLRKGSHVVCPVILEGRPSGINLLGGRRSSFTVKKLECSKQAYAVEYISME
ncbi:hypothetical protein CIL05_21690, partial [Virgibacillus profundi]